MTNMLSIKVRRSSCFTDALKHLHILPDSQFTKTLKLSFLGEIAADYGGPRREFGTLTMKQFAGSSFLTGLNTKKTFCHDALHLQKDTYRQIGRLVSLCILQCGASPKFFSLPVVKYMSGTRTPIIELDDIPDREIRDALKQIKSVTNVTEFRSKIEDLLPQRDEYGINIPLMKLRLDDVDQVVQAVASHVTILRCKAEIDSFLEGLNLYGLRDILQTEASFQKLFLAGSKLELVTVEELIEFKFSPPNTNNYLKEQNVSFNFCLFLQACDNGRAVVFESGRRWVVSLNDFLMFATGSQEMPSEGFPFIKIVVNFNHNDINRYPFANTCAGEITLPVREELTSEDRVVSFMSKALLEGIGFGFC